MEFRRVLFRSPGSGDAFGQFFLFDFESLREAAIAARGGDEAAYLPPPNFSTDRRTTEKSKSAFVQWSDTFGMDMPLHVAVGVRYEETEVTSSALVPIPTELVWAGNNEFTVLFGRSEEHRSELQSLMRLSYAVFCLKK